MKFNPIISGGDLLQVLVLAGAVTGGWFALRADVIASRKDIDRHEHAIVENQKLLTEVLKTQAITGEALKGIRDLLDLHIRDTEPKKP